MTANSRTSNKHLNGHIGKQSHHGNKSGTNKGISNDNQQFYDEIQAFQNVDQFSQRSMNDTYGMHTDRKLMMQEESEQVDESINDSFDDDGPNNMKYSDFKDDRQIVKSAA